MIDSAKSEDLGLRERKRRATQSSLISGARRLTLEHGLTGFTVEQLCDDVGVSRRTFFNYFPGKEDAVLGLTGDGLPHELLTDFVSSGRGPHAVPLLEALTQLFGTFADRMGITRTEYEALSAVLLREPHLLARMFSAAEADARRLTGLIEEREGLPADHPLPRVATLVLGTLARRSVDEFFADGNTLTYPELLVHNVEALGHLFLPTDSPSSQNPTQNQDSA